MAKNDDNLLNELISFLEAEADKVHDIQKIDTSQKVVDSDTQKKPAGATFHYKNGPVDYGTVVVTVYEGNVVVLYNQSTVHDSTRGIDTGWTDFLKKLKSWALRNGRTGFKPMDISNLDSLMQKRKEQENENSLLEGYYGTRNTSYTDRRPGTVKLIIKHNKPLEETDQRFRYIDKIFLETELGERILCPTKKPNEARAYARHIAEGGEYNDDRWKHITEMSNDISKLSGFVRATRNKQFNESAVQVVSEALAMYETLKRTIGSLQGSRGYRQYFDNWKPAITETGKDVDLTSMFKTEQIDHRIEEAMPVLKKLNISMSEMSEATEFESWANGVLESINAEDSKRIDDLVDIINSTKPFEVGVDALNAKVTLEELLDDDSFRDELFSDLDELASQDPKNDAKDTIKSWLRKNKNEKYFEKVLDKIEELPDTEPEPEDDVKKPAPKVPAKPVAKQPSQQTPQQAPKMPQSNPGDAKKIASLMPPPLEEDHELNMIKMLSGVKK
jgi:hypothetical protein